MCHSVGEHLESTDSIVRNIDGEIGVRNIDGEIEGHPIWTVVPKMRHFQ